MSFVVPDEFCWVVAVVALISLQCALVGFAAGSGRSKIFTKEYFKENFPDLVKSDGSYPKNGYPDMGTGYYSKHLTHQQWFDFNNAQRTHYNYIENITQITVVILGAGLYYPRIAVVMGLIYIVARALYTGGYKTYGPHGREVGAITANVVLVAALGFTLYGCFVNGGGVSGFTGLILGSSA